MRGRCLELCWSLASAGRHIHAGAEAAPLALAGTEVCRSSTSGLPLAGTVCTGDSAAHLTCSSMLCRCLQWQQVAAAQVRPRPMCVSQQTSLTVF